MIFPFSLPCTCALVTVRKVIRLKREEGGLSDIFQYAPNLGQSIFSHRCFGQNHFWPVHFWPIHFGPSLFWPRPFLAILYLDLCVMVGAPKFRAFFFPSPAHFCSVCLFGCLLVEFWWCLKCRSPQMCALTTGNIQFPFLCGVDTSFALSLHAWSSVASISSNSSMTACLFSRLLQCVMHNWEIYLARFLPELMQ